MVEEKHLPVEKDGYLYVPGLEKPLERDGIRHIYVEASDLKVTRSFSTIDGKTFDRLIVSGRAWLENCTIGIAGQRPATRELSFHCKACDLAKPDGEWLIHLGFLEGSWEIGTDDQWFIECYVPKPVFDEFVNTHRAGNANGLKLSCTTNMWADSSVRWAPISDNIEWKIPNGKYGPDLGQGRIDNFHWEVIPKRPDGRRNEEKAYQMGRAFAEDTINAVMAESKSASEPAKQISKWWWFAGGVAIALWWLAKTV